MKLTVYNPKTEIMSIKREKEKNEFSIETDADVTVYSSKDGDFFWVDMGEKRYKIENSNGCLEYILIDG